MKNNNVSKAILAILICQAAGIVGSFFTMPSIATWYAGLVKPVFSPPNWIFAPVWTTLFTLMGISAFLIWRAGLNRREVKIALAVFIGQLVLNTCWSIIFFGLHSPMAAFFEIIVLWSFILASIILFAKISKLAAVLLVPYILWVSFAAVLNYFIWRLNF
jgi:tryptophan-rich sensory protein